MIGGISSYCIYVIVVLPVGYTAYSEYQVNYAYAYFNLTIIMIITLLIICANLLG